MIKINLYNDNASLFQSLAKRSLYKLKSMAGIRTMPKKINHRDLTELGERMLKGLIEYRNLLTGEGHFLSGVGDKAKVRSGYRMVYVISLGLLRDEMEKIGGVSHETLKVYDQACKKMERIENKMRPISRKIRDIVDFFYEEFSPEVRKEMAHEYEQLLMRKIRPYEIKTLVYLKLIDEQIDILLHLFNVDKYTKL